MEYGLLPWECESIYLGLERWEEFSCARKGEVRMGKVGERGKRLFI